MTSHRLFFALWPDDAVRDDLLRWQTHNLPAQARWQHRDDIHMTLHFLGEVDAGRVPALIDLGARCAGQGFSLVLDQTGFWGRAKVLWAGPTSTPGALTALFDRLRDGLHGLDFETESRAYRPHVTLARGLGAEPNVKPLAPLPWPVRDMALVESRRGPSPLYHPLARWPLQPE